MYGTFISIFVLKKVFLERKRKFTLYKDIRGFWFVESDAILRTLAFYKEIPSFH